MWVRSQERLTVLKQLGTGLQVSLPYLRGAMEVVVGLALVTTRRVFLYSPHPRPFLPSILHFVEGAAGRVVGGRRPTQHVVKGLGHELDTARRGKAGLSCGEQRTVSGRAEAAPGAAATSEHKKPCEARGPQGKLALSPPAWQGASLRAANPPYPRGQRTTSRSSAARSMTVVGACQSRLFEAAAGERLRERRWRCRLGWLTAFAFARDGAGRAGHSLLAPWPAPAGNDPALPKFPPPPAPGSRRGRRGPAHERPPSQGRPSRKNMLLCCPRFWLPLVPEEVAKVKRGPKRPSAT